MTDDPRDRPPQGARGGTRAPEIDVAPKPREPHIPPGGLPFGRYALLRRISYGGMGEIFLAKQHGLGSFKKLLVIKRLLPHYREDADIVKMFFDEAKLQSSMSDRHVVQIWDMGEVDNHYFIAMEYVQGQSWRRLIERLKERGEHIHPVHAVDLAVQVCRGLSFAHNLVDGNGRALNVVHRDVNPQNVLLSYDGECKIIDFGIAKSALSGVHTEEGTIKGKFAYMAPEQARAEQLDRRSDIFAFGICLYELLTTKNPFYRKNVVLSLEAICEKEAPPLEQVRPAVAAISPVVERCLMKNRDDRFADMAEVAEALTGVYADGLLGDPPVSLTDWLHDIFELEIDEQTQFLLANGFSSISLKRPSTESDPQLHSPYGVGAEISTRKTRALVESRSVSDESVPEPPTEKPSHGDTHPTATLALDVDVVSRPDNLAPATEEAAARVSVPGEFSEDTEIPTEEATGNPRAASGCMLFAIAILTALAGAVGAFYVFLVWDQPDRSPESALARLDVLLGGEDDNALWPQNGPPADDTDPGRAAAPDRADAGAALAEPGDDDDPEEASDDKPVATPPVDEQESADAGARLAIAARDDGAEVGDAADAGAAAVAPDEPDDSEPEKLARDGRRRRGDRRRGRRQRPASADSDDKPAAEEPAPKAEIVGMVTVNAGGPYRIRGGGVSAKNVARVKLVAGKAKTLSIRGAPLAVKLRLEDKGGALSVRVGAEPWAIVRVNNLGKGRTPLSLSVKKGGRLAIELKSPKAGDMRITLGYAAP